jgi:glycosyltransferase involved in cell wall biosynthesis
VLVGRAARFDPQKDLRAFVRAAATVMRGDDRVRAVMCGKSLDRDNPRLVAWVAATGFGERFHLLGRRDDMPEIYAALDLACSSSVAGEAAPNAIGEAMAHGLPVVTTDVGDSALLVGATGWVVAPGDVDALAAARAEAVSLPGDARAARGERARDRIAERFSLDGMVHRYEDLYERLASNGAP